MADPNPPAAAVAADPLAPREDFAPIHPIQAWEIRVEKQLMVDTPIACHDQIALEYKRVTAEDLISTTRRYAYDMPRSRDVLTILFTRRMFGDEGMNLWRFYMANVLAGTSAADTPDGRRARNLALFLAARLTEGEIANLRQHCNTAFASGYVHGTSRPALTAALEALGVEETRRANRAAYVARRNDAGRDRDAMMQADLGVFADRMPGGRDVFNHIIAPMVSGFVTSRHDPLRPTETGPLPSNRDRLAQVVADAQVAVHAAAANHAHAPALLSGVARSIAELNDSVQESNKRHKH